MVDAENAMNYRGWKMSRRLLELQGHAPAHNAAATQTYESRRKLGLYPVIITSPRPALRQCSRPILNCGDIEILKERMQLGVAFVISIVFELTLSPSTLLRQGAI